MRTIIFFAVLVCFSMPSYGSANNLETCLSGKFPTLCKRSLLTADQLVQVKNAEQYSNKNTKGFVSGLGSNLGQVVMSVGGGDMMNLATGHYIMDMGGGDKMNLATGDYIMDMGGGDKMNLTTGDYIMNMGGGDKMNLGTGDYLMNMGGGDMMNLATGAMTFSFD